MNNKKYSFTKLFLLGLVIDSIKALTLAFALNLTGKVLFRIMHEEFTLIVKSVLTSEELYQDTLFMAVIMLILTLPGTYVFAAEHVDKQQE